MHDDQHIANALQCHSTRNRSHLETVKNVSVKAFYLALIVGAVHVSTRPNASTSAIRFISACQSLTRKRHIDHPVREQAAQSGCVKQEMPPGMLANAG
jgi:hypothetical protein